MEAVSKKLSRQQGRNVRKLCCESGEGIAKLLDLHETGVTSKRAIVCHHFHMFASLLSLHFVTCQWSSMDWKFDRIEDCIHIT